MVCCMWFRTRRFYMLGITAIIAAFILMFSHSKTETLAEIEAFTASTLEHQLISELSQQVNVAKHSVIHVAIVSVTRISSTPPGIFGGKHVVVYKARPKYALQTANIIGRSFFVEGRGSSKIDAERDAHVQLREALEVLRSVSDRAGYLASPLLSHDSTPTPVPSSSTEEGVSVSPSPSQMMSPASPV
jgi:hypothetical protein